jgi:hypothetical protein
LLKTFAASVLRLLARLALAAWFGGFTFYAAVVVPDLHEHLGGIETGEVSRRVAPYLYAIGATALVFASLVAAIDRDLPPNRRGWGKLAFLVTGAALLATLFGMDRSMGRMLDSGGNPAGFLPFHETYLTVWTGEWLVILGLLALGDAPRREARSTPPPMESRPA